MTWSDLGVPSDLDEGRYVTHTCSLTAALFSHHNQLQVTGQPGLLNSKVS